MTTTIDIPKLQAQANELRGAMVEALNTADDAKVRKLGNELATVNKQILDGEAGAQGDARTEYMGTMHDALSAFETDGMTLTVRFGINDEGQQDIVVVYTPGNDLIDLIKDSIAGIERPSTATKWTYGRDEEGHPSFDFGRGTRKASTATTTGMWSTGWVKDGTEASLGDAFDACATDAQKKEHDDKTTGSQKYSFKVGVVGKAGYTKK